MPFLEYKGKKLFYQFNEKEKDKAIIFIHGSGGSSYVWKNQFNLDIELSIIAVDLPSHNKSDVFLELSLDLYVDCVKCLIDYLKVNKVILCGHSLGGAIIQSYYFNYPNKVDALILCSTGGRLRVSPAILELLKNNYQEFLESLPIISFYRKTSIEIIEEYVKEISKTKPEVTYADFLVCDKFDTLNKTNTINIPCLLICGNADKLTPVKYSQFFREKIKNSVLVIVKNAGHMVMIEKATEVNKSIKEFIKNNL
ncbi:MAG: alpha/beta fold hydrolase [Promethearchaeota archaeon]